MGSPILCETVKLNNGNYMPVVGLGTNLSFDNEVKEAIRNALLCGYRAIDTAFLYQNETAVGEGIQACIREGIVTRDEIFVTSKLPFFGNRAEDVSKYIIQTLSNLQLDYIDLYLVHHPFGLKEDPETTSLSVTRNIDFSTDHISLWRAMETQVLAGRTKAIGLSNFNKKQIIKILKVARIPPACLQIEVHLYLQQNMLINFCKQQNIVVCAFSPLRAPHTEEGAAESPLKDAIVIQIAEKIVRTPAQVLLKFLVNNGCCIIPKSVNEKEIIENFKLDFEIPVDETNCLQSLDRGEPGRVYYFSASYKCVDEHPEYPFERTSIPANN